MRIPVNVYHEGQSSESPIRCSGKVVGAEANFVWVEIPDSRGQPIRYRFGRSEVIHASVIHPLYLFLGRPFAPTREV